MLQNILVTLTLMIVWFDIYQVPNWNRFLKKKPFGCELCLPVYAYVLVSFLPDNIKEVLLGAFLSVVLFNLTLNIIRR